MKKLMVLILSTVFSISLINVTLPCNASGAFFIGYGKDGFEIINRTPAEGDAVLNGEVYSSREEAQEYYDSLKLGEIKFLDDDNTDSNPFFCCIVQILTHFFAV